MRTLALALFLLPSITLADDTDPKALAVTNAYIKEVVELEKKYTAAVDRMKAVLIAEERKQRDAAIEKLQTLQVEATKKQALDTAVSAKNEAEKLKSLSYMAEVKTVPNKYFQAKSMTYPSIQESTGRLFFTPALSDEKPFEWANKRLRFQTNGLILPIADLSTEPREISGTSGFSPNITGSIEATNARAAALETIRAGREADDRNKIGFWRLTKKGELEWLDKDEKVIGLFTFAYTPVGLVGFGSVGDGRHIIYIER